KGIAGAADGEDKIGDVGSEANKGAGGDQNSVNGIADGMKAIVEAAGGAEKVGEAAGAAKNPIAAAIGTNGNGAAFAGNGMQDKNDKIAAAIVLRGMAKGGKFSLADQNDAAHKAGVMLKDVGEAGAGAGNNEAGKLFAGSAGARDGAADADVGKAVAAVNAVSGEQI
uniref:variable large family protein n=1 Tax=Borreliella garinii TaxID=29519 RepID=UPI001AEFEBAC